MLHQQKPVKQEVVFGPQEQQNAAYHYQQHNHGTRYVYISLLCKN